MQSIKTIVVTYPDFQSLPKGLKKMLVTSETEFFHDAKTALNGREELLRGRAPLRLCSSWKKTSRLSMAGKGAIRQQANNCSTRPASAKNRSPAIFMNRATV